jgi:hypothetical protein
MFDENYVPDQRFVAAATTSYGVDTNWYADTDTTNHIIGELDKLTVKTSTLENNRYTLLVEHVWRLVTLVILLFIPLAKIYI